MNPYHEEVKESQFYDGIANYLKSYLPEDEDPKNKERVTALMSIFKYACDLGGIYPLFKKINHSEREMKDYLPRPKFLDYGGDYNTIIKTGSGNYKPFVVEMRSKGWFIPVREPEDDIYNDIVEVMRKHFSEAEVEFACRDRQM